MSDRPPGPASEPPLRPSSALEQHVRMDSFMRGVKSWADAVENVLKDHCTCGSPLTLGTVHRKDKPCFVVGDRVDLRVQSPARRGPRPLNPADRARMRQQVSENDAALKPRTPPDPAPRPGDGAGDGCEAHAHTRPRRKEETDG